MSARSPLVRFRHNIKDEVLRLVRSGNYHMRKSEVEQLARDSELDKSEARQVFFLLGGVLWAGHVIGYGTGHGLPVYEHAPEPQRWDGVAFDVQWFQNQGLAPSPIDPSATE